MPDGSTLQRRSGGGSRRRACAPARSRLAATLALVAAAALGACAPALAPAPVVTTPRHPDFVFPATPATLASGELVARQQRGWQFLQAGDSQAARREFTAALRARPGFYPAQAGLAYVSLADKEYADSIARFDRVLSVAPRYVPALVGRGDALVGASRVAEAVKSFEAALAEDAALPDVRRRLEVLSLRSQQVSLAAARQAAEAGRYDEAAQAYEQAIAISPDSAFLYRELAAVERKQGQATAALQNLRKAAAIDNTDARTYLQIGELLEDESDFAGAAEAYARAEAIEPGEEIAARLARARAGAQLARLPEEYRAIPKSAQITRGELAALIGVRLRPVLESAPARDALVATDVRAHWASRWIIPVVRAGIMDLYPNHTFQPRGLVRRLDLAQVATRLVNLLAVKRPGLAEAWSGARPRIVDLPATHLGYPAAATVVAAGVMPLLDGAFRPSRPVSGAEALDVMGRLEGLVR